MKKNTIVWDFDGTLIPNDPYDSEQSLMLHVLDQGENTKSRFDRILARILVYADSKEQLRKVFKWFYIRFLTGYTTAVFDPVCARLAAKIPEADRRVLRRLSELGHPMLVLSCGTVNLSEGTLEKAGLDGCFDIFAGNRFESQNGDISSMTLHVPDPADKVRFLEKQGIDPRTCMAVGDGYTDIPMLDWSEIPVLVDRTGSKRKKYAHKNYHFVQSLPEILDLL
jgi:phosphoserine phosphatase